MADEVENNGTAETPARMDIKGILLAWERLRIVYNIVLLLVVVFTFLSFGGGDPYFVIKAAFCAFVANLLFCAGPAFEIYVSWLFGTTFSLGGRIVAFLSGMALASCLAFLYTLGNTWLAQMD